jgi:hypothetical protein
MQTTLFDLINAADHVSIDGYDAETIGFVDDGVRIEYYGGEEVSFFKDQTVTLNNGSCVASTAVNPDYESDAVECALTFSVTRMLQASDLAS